MGTVVGNWRLRAIIILFIFYVCMYGANALLYDIDTMSDYENDDLVSFEDTNAEILENETDLEVSGQDEGNSFIDMLSGLFEFLTFGNIDNTFARLLLNTTMTIITITTTYIIYTFIKEWIPLT